MAIHLVRHAAADRHHTDELRPLTAQGTAQASRIVDVLAPLDVHRVVSSRYLRCVQTVQPLADKLGIAVETHAALAEEADVEAAWALVHDAATWAGDTVLCSHGNVIPPLLDRLHRRGVEVVADEWTCNKGSVWTLELDGGDVVRAVLTLARP